MSVYNNWYIAKAKKFEAKATPTEKGTITLEVNAYDVLKIDATPDQWADIISILGNALSKAGDKPQARGGRRTADDY